MKLVSLAVPLLCTWIPQVLASCKTFQPSYHGNLTSEYAFLQNDLTVRVSAIVNCSTTPGNTSPGSFTGASVGQCTSNQCGVSSDEYLNVRLNRIVSIAADAALEQNVFDLAKQYFPSKVDLSTTKVWNLKGGGVAGTCLNVSQAGYWGFNPDYSCVQGSLFDCQGGGGDPPSGTNVTACGVSTWSNSGGQREPTGTYRFVYTVGLESGPAPANATGDAGSRGGLLRTSIVSNPGLVCVLVTLFVYQFL